jgi:hypothetical protein
MFSIDFLSIAIPTVLSLFPISFFIYMISEWKNDSKWEAWLAAHRKWEETREGEAPTTEDFGWKKP